MIWGRGKCFGGRSRCSEESACQYRGRKWVYISSLYTVYLVPVQANADLEEGMSKDTLTIRKGWEWISEWQIDLNRAVNEDGWQFSIDADEGPWVSSERTIHVARRRRWVRTRQRLEDVRKEEKKVGYVPCVEASCVCVCMCVCVRACVCVVLHYAEEVTAS